jgi:queuosine precursor transporter
MTRASGLNTHQKLYVVLVAIFVACLLLGDVIGGKTFVTPLGPVSVGMIPFPVTFLLTDVVNDFYGKKGARFLTIIGFCMALFAWLLLQITTWLHVDESSYFTQPEYQKIFGGSAQLFVASMIAFLIGQFLDIHVFHFWKGLTESKHLWLRATGSTILSQLVDTAAINSVFWKWTAGKEWTWILAKIGREYGIKLVIAVCLTPIVYAIHGAITHLLKIEPEKLAPKER